MKALLALAIASALLLVFAPPTIGLEASASNASLFQAATCLTTGSSALPSFMQPVEASWGFPSLPSCFDIEGTSCTSSGVPVRCMWQEDIPGQQGGEPGICFCQNNTMICG